MERKPSNNDALEAVDFIINVLKEHEKDLDGLIGQLGVITESLGETGEISNKIEKIEDRITNLQDEIINLIKHLNVPRDVSAHNIHSTSVTVKCIQWEDFKNLARGAENVSYLFKETEKTFQADAVVNGKVISYTGEFPNNNQLLKLWISKELEMAEKDVFEGVLSMG
jgi:hypothetical protein